MKQMIKFAIVLLVLSVAFALNSYTDERYEMAMLWSALVGFLAAALFINAVIKQKSL